MLGRDVWQSMISHTQNAKSSLAATSQSTLSRYSPKSCWCSNSKFLLSIHVCRERILECIALSSFALFHCPPCIQSMRVLVSVCVVHCAYASASSDRKHSNEFYIKRSHYWMVFVSAFKNAHWCFHVWELWTREQIKRVKELREKANELSSKRMKLACSTTSTL